jgi:hypothetical protein
MAYKSAVSRCRCVSCANGRANRRRRSPWLISSLKPYWGKPAVRNFRGGGGNVCTVWRLFATQLERADTSEADRPTHARLFSTRQFARTLPQPILKNRDFASPRSLPPANPTPKTPDPSLRNPSRLASFSRFFPHLTPAYSQKSRFRVIGPPSTPIPNQRKS